MKGKPLYLDYQSSTPCSTRVLEAMEPYWSDYFANPSDRQHSDGIYACAASNVSRECLAELLGVDPTRLIFTSGATEANNLALLGYARARTAETGDKGHVITLSTEHLSVLEPLRKLQKEGFRLTELQPNSDGIISLDQFEKAFQKDTFLVSIMMANNEIGVLQPIREIALRCKYNSALLHCDASQALGNIPFNIDTLDIDLLTISAHKIYGPKGIGALIKKKNIRIQPLQWGGGQEQGLRPGTLPLPLVVGFATAAKIAIEDIHTNIHKYKFLRDTLLNDLTNKIHGLKINGSLKSRLPNNLNITVPNVRGKKMNSLLRKHISCSSGSACSNGAPSHVLLALGRSLQEVECSLRLSLGRYTTEEDVSQISDFLTDAIFKSKI